MKQEDANQLFTLLNQTYPNPKTELNYHSHFELLVAVMLSAQSTDVRVNLVTAELFAKANTPEAMLALGLAELKQTIQSIGLFNSKAKHILATAKQLIDQHQSQVPNTRSALEALPGVGRKTANVVLNTAFHQPTIAVDTHVFRLANRTGLANAKTPLAVEQQLLRIIAKPFQLHAHNQMILHGRYVCLARQPKCATCVIQSWCQYPNQSNATEQPKSRTQRQDTTE